MRDSARFTEEVATVVCLLGADVTEPGAGMPLDVMIEETISNSVFGFGCLANVAVPRMKPMETSKQKGPIRTVTNTAPRGVSRP
jgi:hypothetical protein